MRRPVTERRSEVRILKERFRCLELAGSSLVTERRSEVRILKEEGSTGYTYYLHVTERRSEVRILKVQGDWEEAWEAMLQRDDPRLGY